MVAIVLFAFGKKYIRYLPLYLYSLKKIYPDYHVIIYTEYLSDKILNLIKFLRFENIIIKPLPEMGLNTKILKYKQIKKSLRWLHYDNYFEMFKYLYIGDIDIFLCPEKNDLVEQHLQHMKKIDLPYSNVIRQNTNRLSGLHFVEVQPYYSLIKTEQKIMVNFINSLDQKKLDAINNEEILYWLLNRVGLIKNGIVNPDNNFRPMHGLHLGNWRLRDFLHRKIYKNSINHGKYMSCFKYFEKQYFEDDVLMKIIKKSGFEQRLIIRLMILDFSALAKLN